MNITSHLRGFSHLDIIFCISTHRLRHQLPHVHPQHAYQKLFKAYTSTLPSFNLLILPSLSYLCSGVFYLLIYFASDLYSSILSLIYIFLYTRQFQHTIEYKKTNSYISILLMKNRYLTFL